MARLWGLWGLAALFACGGPPRSGARENVLVLELGGGNQLLREALLRFGPPDEKTVQVFPTPPAADPPRAEEPPPSQPPAAREPEVLTVYLRANETLYGLARTHLGSGSRFRELLALNGWTEAEASQLPVGTAVKVPVR